MSRLTLLLAIGVLLAAALIAHGQSRREERGTRGTSNSAFREEYGSLVERNMFIKDRRRPATAPTTSTSRLAPRPPEQTLMLTGVVYEPLAGEAYAFFEDLTAGSLIRVGIGEQVARGMIVEIDIDAVTYEKNSKRTMVAVGHDLTGQRADTVAARSVASPSTSAAAATSAPAIDPNNPNLSLEERMRLRRQQESGRR